MKFRKYRAFFWGVVISAISISTTFDLIALRRSLQFDSELNWIGQKNKALYELEEMQRNIIRLDVDMDSGDQQSVFNSLILLGEHYSRFLNLIADNQTQVTRFQPFQFLQKHDPDIVKQYVSQKKNFFKAIVDAKTTELRQLAEIGEINQRENKAERLKITIAMLVDIVLFVSAGLLWWLYDSARRKESEVLLLALGDAKKINSEMRSLMENRSRQLRNTVHDLKNPLGVIKGFSELIECSPFNAANVLDISQHLQRVSNQTLALVGSLLDSESQTQREESLKISVYIDNVCQALRPVLDKKGQSICWKKTNKELEVFSAPIVFWNIAMNIIENASKYSPKNSEIILSIESQDGFCLFEVEDFGPGFTDDDKQKAFRPFQRLSALPTNGEASSGIGLSNVYESVKKLGGSIEIGNSQMTHGAKVVVKLPLTNFAART